MFVVTRLGGGYGRQLDEPIAATMSKMVPSLEYGRIGRMERKGQASDWLAILKPPKP